MVILHKAQMVFTYRVWCKRRYKLNFVQTTTDIKLVNEGTQSSAFAFTLTGAAIEVALGTSSQELSFTKSTQGDILYVAIAPEANESYTTITPSGAETWTEITEWIRNLDRNRRMRK